MYNEPRLRRLEMPPVPSCVVTCWEWCCRLLDRKSVRMKESVQANLILSSRSGSNLFMLFNLRLQHKKRASPKRKRPLIRFMSSAFTFSGDGH